MSNKIVWKQDVGSMRNAQFGSILSYEELYQAFTARMQAEQDEPIGLGDVSIMKDGSVIALHVVLTNGKHYRVDLVRESDPNSIASSLETLAARLRLDAEQ